MSEWHQEIDFLVIGSGAAGMTAAITAQQLGLSALVLENAECYGGTSALSGGVLWIPNNHLMAGVGIDDSTLDAMTYLQQLIGDEVPIDKLQSFVTQAPKMLQFMQTHSLLNYAPAKTYPDYYSDLAGGKNGARSLDPVPYSIRKLGLDLLAGMREQSKRKRRSFSMTAGEAHILFSFTWRSPLMIYRRLITFWLDVPFRFKNMPDNRLTLGRAMVGRLRKTMAERNIPLWLKTSVNELIVEDGKVCGVRCQKEGRILNIKVNKAVLLASGGFARNADMREKYHSKAEHASYSAASPSDMGTGLQLGLDAGAAQDMMAYAWWTPTLLYPDGGSEAFIVGKSLPHCLVVNKKGLRFCNEAEPYEDFVKHQFVSQSDGDEAVPAYFIFDARYRHEYPVGMGIAPGKFLGDSHYAPLFTSGWIKKADTLIELAALCGIDEAGLLTSIEKMGAFAKTGIDTDFMRGEGLADRYYSDHRIGPNPCLSAVDSAPFYAIKLWPGDLGTKGGLVTNKNACVLNTHGQVIEGLYATGNVTASVMGNSYPAAGSTLGPALTFGYIAACHAAGECNE